jgi:hypothetical protein
MSVLPPVEAVVNQAEVFPADGSRNGIAAVVHLCLTREEHTLGLAGRFEQPATHRGFWQEADVHDGRHAGEIGRPGRNLIVLVLVDVNEIDPFRSDSPH